MPTPLTILDPFDIPLEAIRRHESANGPNSVVTSPGPSYTDRGAVIYTTSQGVALFDGAPPCVDKSENSYQYVQQHLRQSMSKQDLSQSFCIGEEARDSETTMKTPSNTEGSMYTESERADVPLTPEAGFEAFSHLKASVYTSDAALQQPKMKPKKTGRPRGRPRKYARTSITDFRPRTSIPESIPPEEFARQCILAAESSRLDPFTLHPLEYDLLKQHINKNRVTIYLNIRNAILRLWTRNPMLSVTAEEAVGCAKETRYTGLATVAYEWLVRNGYINFGCVEVPVPASIPRRPKAIQLKQPVVVVVGAGIAGLGCARHLESLIEQLGDKWSTGGLQKPQVIVLEGRNRIGGRVYSQPLQWQDRATSHNTSRALRHTAEMGAQIITGFNRGNPLDILIRGQLGLHYYSLKDDSILYDFDGSEVDKKRDSMVEKLYIDIVDRAKVHHQKPCRVETVGGDKNLIYQWRDPVLDEGPALLGDTARQIPADTAGQRLPKSNVLEQVPAGIDKLTGKMYLSLGDTAKTSAAGTAKSAGWKLREGVDPTDSIDLSKMATIQPCPSLGAAMDEAISQYQEIIDLRPQDMRLLNWHKANLEYANAANLNELSLAGWDQDMGNEFDGEHTEIIGGYTQVARGLWRYPTSLDIRFRHKVTNISYHAEDVKGSGLATIICDNGDFIEADHVVVTIPLGVLKERSIHFQPSLPDWKSGAIERLGFGLLNKVVLVYEKPFWEQRRDMFGLLNEAEIPNSLLQQDYSAKRGRFYLFWNRTEASGRPMLVALMAGDAAQQAERSSDEDLIADVTARLARIFGPFSVPSPVEVIITRWKSDPFARGSYSYVGKSAQPGDYDAMARAAGNLHFAGEATTGTHPATVHGAYLSGLRAASEVITDMLGPIQLPQPLVQPRSKAPQRDPQQADEPAKKLKSDRRQEYDESFELAVLAETLHQIGERPQKPGRCANPFLLFQKDYWAECKANCDEAQRSATGDPAAKASKEEVRIAMGRMWHDADPETKRPYLQRTQDDKDQKAALMPEFKDNFKKWERDAARIRQEYIRNHPRPP